MPHLARLALGSALPPAHTVLRPRGWVKLALHSGAGDSGGQVICLGRVVTRAESKPSPSEPEAGFVWGSPDNGVSRAGI